MAGVDSPVVAMVMMMLVVMADLTGRHEPNQTKHTANRGRAMDESSRKTMARWGSTAQWIRAQKLRVGADNGMGLDKDKESDCARG